MSEKNILLSVKNLNVEYSSGGDIIHAVNGVSFDLEKGKTLGLVGETGAGKTTVAKSIIRVLQTPPAKITGGEIYFKGEELLQKPNDEMTDIRGREISMIFQDPMTALNPTMTIGNQISESILRHTNLSATEAKIKALEMLEAKKYVNEKGEHLIDLICWAENWPDGGIAQVIAATVVLPSKG